MASLCYNVIPPRLIHRYQFPSSSRSLWGSFSLLTSSITLPFASICSPVKAASHNAFTWDDVLRLSQLHPHDALDLTGFFDKINLCNRGSELAGEFVQFRVDGHGIGYVHHILATKLKAFKHVFDFPDEKCGFISFAESLKTVEERTDAFDEIIKWLAGEKGGKIISGIRNEWYPVGSSFSSAPCFFMERAAARYFGIKAYGVHMNGYVEKDGEKFLWIGKRSASKPTYPSMLDHLVAGGLPHGMSCQENLIKECEEEAGIPEALALEAKPVGAVSYSDINGYEYKRDVLFCYDLKLPKDFVPIVVDGEVESFKLMPVGNVWEVIWRGNYFKDNCNLVIIDFLFRHGYITPESPGYLKLLDALRSGDCS